MVRRQANRARSRGVASALIANKLSSAKTEYGSRTSEIPVAVSPTVPSRTLTNAASTPRIYDPLQFGHARVPPQALVQARRERDCHSQR